MNKSPFQSNTLFYGDNLDVLRKYLPNECVDLIYLDPPFNSKADYNVLFKESSGEESVAQIQAFSDFWHWDKTAERTYLEIQDDPKLTDMVQFLHAHLGRSDMMAYLVMMATRLRELHRVIKPTGSLYLHCDPTASHYLRVLLDAIFSPYNFRNEIVWRRSHPKGHAFTRLASNHDTIIVYAKDARQVKWKMSYRDYDPEILARTYRLKDPDGRAYTLDNLLNPNLNRPHLTYQFKGMTRVWRWTKERMLEEDAKGRIVVPRDGKGVPRYKRYLDEQEGVPIDDFWEDIDYVKGGERLGYPTQKPLKLLERIINAASDEGDWVLDPFCGCGTSILAAQELKRKWIGIDITHLAISLIRARLKDIHVLVNRDYRIIGEPVDLASAVELMKTDPTGYQFQWWSLSLIDARPASQSTTSPQGKKGADKGVDGWLTFKESDSLDLKRVVVQVKGGHVGAQTVRDLIGTVESSKSAMGILITLHEPTEQMKQAAMEAEYYESPTWGHKYPKIQIITIPELLKGSKPILPHTH
jgi:site-specific DNA-methyltransferase (adenine-specific)